MATQKKSKKQDEQQPVNLSDEDMKNIEILADKIESGGGEAIEHLAANLLYLNDYAEPGNMPYVQDWIDTLIQECFFRSRACHLAKHIYRSMHKIDGFTSPAALLEDVIATRIKGGAK